MSKDIFQQLCDEIEVIIGRGKFKSEAFLDKIMESDDQCCRRMMIANQYTAGGFICGEIKLVITLRILGGGTPLDLALMFDTSFSTPYQIFHEVVTDWLSNEKFCPIDGIEYYSDDDHMKGVALQFCEAS